jgi:hypothetical protein
LKKYFQKTKIIKYFQKTKMLLLFMNSRIRIIRMFIRMDEWSLGWSFDWTVSRLYAFVDHEQQNYDHSLWIIIPVIAHGSSFLL